MALHSRAGSQVNDDIQELGSGYALYRSNRQKANLSIYRVVLSAERVVKDAGAAAAPGPLIRYRRLFLVVASPFLPGAPSSAVGAADIVHQKKGGATGALRTVR